jgi:hypothetical protein
VRSVRCALKQSLTSLLQTQASLLSHHVINASASVTLRLNADELILAALGVNVNWAVKDSIEGRLAACYNGAP